MKEGWEYKKLGDVADVIHGKNQKEVLSVNGTYPIYGSGGNVMGYASDYLCEAGSTILGRKGSINNPLYITKRFWNVDTAFGISAKDGYDGKFLYYFITTIDWLKKNTGTTLPSLTQQVVKSVTIPVPPLSEQRSIVDYLDSAFAKIDAMKANAEKALNEAKALFQASLKEMLEPKEGWEEQTLKEICRVINGRAYSKDEMLKQGKYRLLRVGNFFTNDSWYYSDLELEEDKYCDNGDLLYAWSASFGPRIWDGEKVIYHYHIWKMVCSVKIDKYFLCYWLDSDELKKQVMTNLHGTTMAHITKGIIEATHVAFPSLSEQHSIVTTLDSLKSKVDRLQANYEKISQECDALKQALLRQVFE